MNRAVMRINRWMLGLIGLILLAAGAFLIGHSAGWWPGLTKYRAAYSQNEMQWLHRHDYIWIAAAVVAVVIGLIAVRWLLVQPRLDRVKAIRIEPERGKDAKAGITRLPSDVFTDAVEDDVIDHPGVARVRALLIGSTDAPELILRVRALPRSDMADIHRHIVETALPAARAALAPLELDAQIHLQVAGRRDAPRVVR